ncbi:unnamed protein product [Victoria cruziana]
MQKRGSAWSGGLDLSCGREVEGAHRSLRPLVFEIRCGGRSSLTHRSRGERGRPGLVFASDFLHFLIHDISLRGKDLLSPSTFRMKTSFLFFSLLAFYLFPSCTVADSPEYTACAPTTCNGISISYPFSLSSAYGIGCGFPGLNLTCREDEANTLFNTSSGLHFIVKGIDYTTQTFNLTIPSSLMKDSPCRRPSANITLSKIINGSHLPLSLAASYRSVTLFYGCSNQPFTAHGSDSKGEAKPGYNFTSNVVSACSTTSDSFYSYAFFDDADVANIDKADAFLGCQERVSFPVLPPSFSSDARDMESYFSEEFDLVWAVDTMGVCADCTASGGRCGYNTTTGYFGCFCKRESLYGNCNRHSSKWTQAIIGMFLKVILIQQYICLRIG